MVLPVTPQSEFGTDRTISGYVLDNSGAVEGAQVALKRASGNLVAFAETDSSGHYNFTIPSGSGDFDVVTPTGKNLTQLNKISNTQGRKDSSYYTGGGVVYVQDFPQTNGSPATYWTGTPTVTITTTGDGSGAKVRAELANVGEFYKDYSSRLELTEKYGSLGQPAKHFKIEDWGRDYMPWDVTCTVAGTRVLSGDGSQPNSFRSPDDGNWYYTEPHSYTLGVNVASPQITDLEADVLEGYYGPQAYGLPASDYDGGYYDLGLIGTSEFNNGTDYDSDADHPSAGIDQLEATLRDTDNYQSSIDPSIPVYFNLMYGTNTAVAAYDRGDISLKELDRLKGWFGRHYVIESLIPGNDSVTSALATDFFDLGWQITQGVVAGVTGAWNTVTSDYLSIYNGQAKTVFLNAMMAEFRSFSRQSKGIWMPESAYASKIKPILEKAGINEVYTGEGANRKKYTFGLTAITKTNAPE